MLVLTESLEYNGVALVITGDFSPPDTKYGYTGDFEIFSVRQDIYNLANFNFYQTRPDQDLTPIMSDRSLEDIKQYMYERIMARGAPWYD